MTHTLIIAVTCNITAWALSRIPCNYYWEDLYTLLTRDTNEDSNED